MADPHTPLRSFRRSQTPKMSLKVLATRVGVSESQLSRIERDGTHSLPQAIALAKATGLPVESFAPAADESPAD